MATVPGTSGQNGVPLPANTAPLTAHISSAGISGSNINWNPDLLALRIAYLGTFSLQSPDTALTAPLSFPQIILTPSYNGFWMLSSYYSSGNLRAPRFRATKHEFISVVFLSCKRELCTSFTKPSLTLAPCYQACFMVCLVASNQTWATGSLATQYRQSHLLATVGCLSHVQSSRGINFGKWEVIWQYCAEKLPTTNW